MKTGAWAKYNPTHRILDSYSMLVGRYNGIAARDLPVLSGEPMNAETVREFLTRQPFQPLQVHLSNGEVHQIPHPEFAMLLESTLVIGVPDSDRVICCDLLHVTSVERAPASQPA